jgi:predicted nucleic acid-binding protein
MSSLPTSMTIVVDASITMRALLPVSSEQAFRQFEQWRANHFLIRAPDLWYVEVVTAIRKAVFHRLITFEDGRGLLHELPALGIEIIPSDERICEAAYEWAERLGQSKAYDGFYLALSQRLGVELWTADKRLANRAQQIGVTWIRTTG